MGGVGTFDKECRTLYVGGLANRTKLEKLLWSEFGEWGEIEVKIYIARNIKKEVCISNTTTLHVHHAFLCISLLSLYYYDLEMSIFTFFARGGRQHSTFFFFS